MRNEPGSRANVLHVAAFVAVIAEFAFTYYVFPVLASFCDPGAQVWMFAFALYSTGTITLCVYSASEKSGWTRFILPALAIIAAVTPSIMFVPFLMVI